MIYNQIHSLLQGLNESLNNILRYPYISSSNTKLESFLYLLEKFRFDIYEQVDFLNDYLPEDEIHTINNDYNATLRDNVLCLYIPDKLPNLKHKSSYAHKQIILNIAEITKPYERLFYDKFVIVVVKIYEKRKVWDVDNRTVKPIQDGFIYGNVIKDDNLFNCCYMVQGFYSDTPHIEVFVLEADKILQLISMHIPSHFLYYVFFLYHI